MAKVVSQTIALTELNAPTPNQNFNNGLQMAQEIDSINKEKGVRSNWAAEWKRKYSKKFGCGGSGK